MKTFDFYVSHDTRPLLKATELTWKIILHMSFFRCVQSKESGLSQAQFCLCRTVNLSAGLADARSRNREEYLHEKGEDRKKYQRHLKLFFFS